jgi:chemotaxis signal transduction protein
MTTELKIGDLVKCFDTEKSFKIHKFHPIRYDIVMVNDVNDAKAGFLYVEVNSLVKLCKGRFQSVHVPGSTDAPDFLRKYYSV